MTVSTRLIDTRSFAEQMRAKIIRPATAEVLLSRLKASDQEGDLTKPPNCAGLGRIRHFRRDTAEGWPPNPLPIDPACAALGVKAGDLLTAQVFQNAACAWRCWYCFVPFNMLAGDERRGRWITADELVSLYAAEPDAPRVVDLSGGSPDLTPEWVVWVMDALERAGLSERTYLWSDDNLSTDYIFTKLSPAQRKRLETYGNYGRVCCFKGYDEASFAFNTGAEPGGFQRQFELFSRYLDLGLDLYGYVTLTGPDVAGARAAVFDFVDRLQAVAEQLPLRVVPLKVAPFGPMLRRSELSERAAAWEVQEEAIGAWNETIASRFAPLLRSQPITAITLRP